MEGGVVRALTWRWLFRIQRGGARLQGQFEARARQSQLTQQDPHAAEHIALTARTHSQSVASRRTRGGARKYVLADVRCDTEAAAAEAGGYIAAPDVTAATSPR
ncbi:unnamed protein product [Danaus chrysippus]|uniref:(African queen) hypothetical protein n=1 Tax=Danaus chrysippus TaxID=151541 RepID=A0A8J2QP06_9NEOP|nr:unnamed protein product [Danaus chrysippus]